MAKLRVALCQINSVVGDIAANTERILAALHAAEESGCHAAVFPELAVTGYPPEDLLLKRRFVADSRQAMEHIAARSRSCTAVVGFVDGADGCRNAAGIAADGRLLGVYHKRELPNYGVFDERRYFRPGVNEPGLHNIAGVSVGVSICEDAWVSGGPMSQMAAAGAEVIFNLNASPYHEGKPDQRLGVLRQRAGETGCPIAYANLVGGQDELVFDGASLVMSPDGRVIAQAPPFREHRLIAEVEVADRSGLPPPPAIADDINAVHPGLGELDEQYEALVLATRDYVHKNGFTDVGIGLSGGIDSSLVAAIAADALGAGHVHGVLMPSRYSSGHSVADAQALCQNLGIDHRIIPVEPGHRAFLEMLAPSFEGLDSDLAEENVQSRIRGTLLMALSNKFGWLILTTGNKSESAVGYSTLYGDTAGAYAVIKDLWKLQVYAFARHRNQRAGVDLIPENVLAKPPSAELRPDQRDDQSLPPYEVLDPLLEAYVERDLTPADLLSQGHPPELVSRITGLVDRAEYKRRQNPPGVRITAKAFGRDRRLPITNRYQGPTR
ncbi:NAD+ synthase [Candidatus Poriferisocius sp.]|uniref:NAD+ synthase n=1 Tax=Candidatus Poriferisocius sp. TaxID=3101276 RepID=UPI003B01EE71